MPGNRQRKRIRDQDVSYRRKDEITRLIVDIGLNYLPSLGLDKAAQFLRDKNVPEKVTIRVLTSPQKRRKY